jgi:cysteinyl-tRNA synthetase
MIDLVGRLMKRELAYQANDGSVYYAISKFAGYGRLSRLDTRTIKPGARVAADDYNKEDVRDCALWKAAKAEDERTGAAWDSPWGRGRPGWHLECSAMAMKYLGETLDLHCGGVDLIFPHHEDEIAQSEGATGVPFARTWCHGEFLQVEGSKMAKRVGNVITVETLRERHIPGVAARHLLFSVHYRQQLNLKDEALEGSAQAVRRIGEFADRLAKARGGTAELARAAEDAERDVRAALFDDLNAPKAVAALFTFLKRANTELDRGGDDVQAVARARAAFATIDGVLDLTPRPQDSDGDEDARLERERLAEWVEERLAARREARAARNFALADAIRLEIEQRGIEVKDGPGGTEWRAVRAG